MEKLNYQGDQSASQLNENTSYLVKESQQVDNEGGSVMVDATTVESMQRLILSEQTQRLENCKNTNWQLLEMLVAILQQHTAEQTEEIFKMHHDLKHAEKVVLTEAQFNLVKKVYPRGFLDNKFSQNDPQIITQFFMNLKALYVRISRQGESKQ